MVSCFSIGWTGLGLLCTSDGRLNTLRGLIGKIPSNPLWAEMLARKQQEAKERAAIKKMGSSTSLKKRAERERQRESVVGGMSAQAGTRAEVAAGVAVLSPRKK